MSLENPVFQPEQLQSERPQLNEISKSLLVDAEISALPIEQQGRVIMDRFIGSVVRQGEIVGKLATYGPSDVLKVMDRVGATGIQEVTRTNGLRDAVNQLALDGRTATMFGMLDGRLKNEVDTAGNDVPTLTSVAQLEGYLLAGGAENTVKTPRGGIHMDGDSWIPVIVDEVQMMNQDPNRTWMTTTEANEMAKSDSKFLRNVGNDWAMATRTASEVGIDLALVKRSAETIQLRTKSEHDLGAIALFVVTESKVASYKNNLDRRSGY
jgi:hypothetical protein